MIRVTDHALLCFLDRVGGLDVEALRAAVERSLARAATAAETIGGGDYLIAADGNVFVVRDGAVVTVLEPTGPAGRYFALSPEKAGQ